MTDNPFDVDSVKPGDVVGVDDPKWAGRWVVRKVNPTTIVLDPEGGGRGLKAHKTLIAAPPVPGESPFQRVAGSRPEGLRTAALVRARRPLGSHGLDTLYVVIKDGFDKVNIAPLGGDPAGHYWRIAPRGLVVVDPAEVLKAA